MTALEKRVHISSNTLYTSAPELLCGRAIASRRPMPDSHIFWKFKGEINFREEAITTCWTWKVWFAKHKTRNTLINIKSFFSESFTMVIFYCSVKNFSKIDLPTPTSDLLLPQRLTSSIAELYSWLIIMRRFLRNCKYIKYAGKHITHAAIIQ